ncbi:Argonaute siRNA chaperone complex subunit Arb1-domain-containing protein [Cercophora newfieldiana]|uniref:Argonaute siRNA chaperone complex subunit Arb1-domain-containing protein n=1 Tax=Cercophora newfieldiana TaxID=92897 RepID=A0AA39XYF6_9PEZI|nr:Argonaute siRNA chaperone complex subunit Arb1-domain-containing protein [Cercophora newfieldiana]
MLSRVDNDSATAGDAAGHVDNETSPHAEDGTPRLAVAGPDGLATPSVGELREVIKRKKKRPNNRKKKRGTGFEEYFCDPPMTLEEYNEEQNDLYPAHRPFPERMQECVQRFRVRRRMNSDQNKLFSHYLMLGGVDATQRQFQGTSKMTKGELNELTKGEVRDISANDVIQRGGDGQYDTRFYNPDFPEHWDVDFTGIVAGYLSGHLSDVAMVDMELFKSGVNVVSNFLKYVDRHDVCPEYSEDIREAIDLCEQALEEIPRILDVTTKFPGDFNSAANTLFCKGRMEDFEFDNYAMEPSDEQPARTIFGVHAAILLDQERSGRLAKLMSEKGLHPIQIAEETFEVVEISPPSDAVRAYYKQVNQHLGKNIDIRPCGSLTVVPTFIQDGFDRVMPKTVAKGSVSTQVLFLEEDMLESLGVGLKIEMVTFTLSAEDLKFIKYIRRILPEFYTYLPQELMFHFREPRKTDRPARSIHDKNTGGDHDDMFEDSDAGEDADDVQEKILESVPVGELSIEDGVAAGQEACNGGGCCGNGTEIGEEE